MCLKYNSVQLLNATEEDEWVLDCCRTNAGIITQTPVGCFQLSAAKQSPCYLEENELPNISRLNHLILKWMPEGFNRDPTNIHCHTASVLSFFSPHQPLLHFNMSHIYMYMGFMEVWKCYIIKHLFIQGFNTSCLWRPKLCTPQQTTAEEQRANRSI